MQKEKKLKTLREIFMENELPLNGKSELDLKYEKAIEIILNADTIEETAFDINDKKERDRVFDQIKKDWATAFSIFVELGKAGHAESLYKQGLCCCYGIAQEDNNNRYLKAAIVYFNGKYVGTFTGLKVMVSDNGIDWEEKTLTHPYSMSFWPSFLAYGNGILLTSDAANGNMAKSTDGINWTALDTGWWYFAPDTKFSVRDAAYNDGKWVVGGDINKFIYDPDEPVKGMIAYIDADDL